MPFWKWDNGSNVVKVLDYRGGGGAWTSGMGTTRQAESRRRSWRACRSEREIVEYTTAGSGSCTLFLGDKTVSFFSLSHPLSSFLGLFTSLLQQISSSSLPPLPSPVCLTLQICEAMHGEWISQAEASDSPLWSRPTGRQAGRQSNNAAESEGVNERKG